MELSLPDIQKILSPGMYELLLALAEAGDADLVIELLCEIYGVTKGHELYIPEFHQPFIDLDTPIALDLGLIKDQLPDINEDKYPYAPTIECLFNYITCLRHKHSPNPGDRIIQVPNVLQNNNPSSNTWANYLTYIKQITNAD